MGTRLTACHVGYGALVFFAALNRNTAVFLVLFYALLGWRMLPARFWLIWLAFYATLCVSAIGTTYLLQGVGVTYWTPEAILFYNLEVFPLEGLLQVGTLFGAWGFLLRRGLRHANRFLWAFVPALILYSGVIVVFGAWTETRLWAPVLPLLIAIALSAERRTQNVSA